MVEIILFTEPNEKVEEFLELLQEAENKNLSLAALYEFPNMPISELSIDKIIKEIIANAIVKETMVTIDQVFFARQLEPLKQYMRSHIISGKKEPSLLVEEHPLLRDIVKIMPHYGVCVNHPKFLGYALQVLQQIAHRELEPGQDLRQFIRKDLTHQMQLFASQGRCLKTKQLLQAIDDSVDAVKDGELSNLSPKDVFDRLSWLSRAVYVYSGVERLYQLLLKLNIVSDEITFILALNNMTEQYMDVYNFACLARDESGEALFISRFKNMCSGNINLTDLFNSIQAECKQELMQARLAQEQRLLELEKTKKEKHIAAIMASKKQEAKLKKALGLLEKNDAMYQRDCFWRWMGPALDNMIQRQEKLCLPNRAFAALVARKRSERKINSDLQDDVVEHQAISTSLECNVLAMHEKMQHEFENECKRQEKMQRRARRKVEQVEEMQWHNLEQFEEMQRQALGQQQSFEQLAKKEKCDLFLLGQQKLLAMITLAQRKAAARSRWEQRLPALNAIAQQHDFEQRVAMEKSKLFLDAQQELLAHVSETEKTGLFWGTQQEMLLQMAEMEKAGLFLGKEQELLALRALAQKAIPSASVPLESTAVMARPVSVASFFDMQEIDEVAGDEDEEESEQDTTAVYRTPVEYVLSIRRHRPYDCRALGGGPMFQKVATPTCQEPESDALLTSSQGTQTSSQAALEQSFVPRIRQCKPYDRWW